MADRATIALLCRRVGFGPTPGRLDELEALGVDGTVDRLVGSGPGPDDDAFAGLTLHDEDPATRRRQGIAAIDRWLDHLIAAERPGDEWAAWFWHGHLVSSAQEVPYPVLMARQVNRYRRLGLGSFRDLLAETTLDPAMLLYLDGAGSTAAAPNENYGREMLELFALGIGNYGEADVQAAAAALTGYRIRRGTGEPYFVPSEHDPGPHRLLGRDVDGVDAVVDTVVGHRACAPFVTRSLAEAVLGPDADATLLDTLADDFRAGGLDLRGLLRTLLVALAEGRGGPIVSGPTPWLVAAQRATGARLDARSRVLGLFGAGHLPWVPPNVGGWPGGSAWLSSATTVGRVNLARAVAAATPDDAMTLDAAARRDHGALADLLGRPEGFTAPTVAALDEAARAGGRPGDAVLATALCSPDLVVI